MIRCYIAIGSNLNQPLRQVTQAVCALQTLPNSQFICSSAFYRNPPLTQCQQPDYINAVVAIDSHLSPQALLTQLQSIEQQQGRVRGDDRWAARSLDLDILLYGDQCIHTESLTIPHYDLNRRVFFLFPLQQIAPNIRLPTGEMIGDLLAKLDDSELVVVADTPPIVQ